MPRPLLLFCALLLTPLGLSAADLRVSGSDLLQDLLTPVLAGLSERSEAVAIETTFEGSVTAREALESGRADLAILAIPSDQATPGEGHVVIPLAFDVTIVAVNESNPLKELSLQKLAAVIGTSGVGSVSKWGELGLSGSWAARNITPVLPGPWQGITRSMVQHIVLRDRQAREGVASYQNRQQALALLAQNQTAIVVLRGNQLPQSGRALYLSSAEDDYAYPPTDDSVFFGNYPLRLPFYIVFKAERTADVRPLVTELLSDEVADAITAEHLVPVPRSERRESVMRLQ